MRLYYSGALEAGGVQKDPTKSLGGFVSASPVPNNSDNNIFPAITKQVVNKLYQDCRLIVLKNTTTSPISNIIVHTVRGTYSTVKIAAVSPAIDACSNPVFEAIDGPHDLPFQADLETHEIGSPITIAGPLAAGACIGFWLQRTLDETQFTYIDGLQGSTDPDCPTLNTLLTAQIAQPVQTDTEQLVINW